MFSSTIGTVMAAVIAPALQLAKCQLKHDNSHARMEDKIKGLLGQ